MPNELEKKSEELMKALVEDVKAKLPVIKKLKAMSKLAKDIGEGAPELESVLETAEGFAKMVIDRFEKKPKG